MVTRAQKNTENRTKTAILWDKQCFRDLVAINYRVKIKQKRFVRHNKVCSQKIKRL